MRAINAARRAVSEKDRQWYTELAAAYAKNAHYYAWRSMPRRCS